MDKKNNNVNDFWKNYRNIVVAEGVPEATADWYLRWARRFAVSIKGKPIRSRSSEDVRNFFDAFIFISAHPLTGLTGWLWSVSEKASPC